MARKISFAKGTTGYRKRSQVAEAIARKHRGCPHVNANIAYGWCIGA